MTETRTYALAAALAIIAACGTLTVAWVLGVLAPRVHILGPGLLCLAPLLVGGAAFALVLTLARRQR